MNNNNFENARGNNNNEDLSNFIGYNNYYQQLRAEKGRGRNNNINVGPLKEFWEQDDFYVEHIKPELELMENNIPTRKSANIKSTAPLSRADLFKRALASTDRAEYKRLADLYKELESPPPFIEFFMSERLKKRGGKRRARRATRTKRHRRNKKRRTSRK